MAMNPELKAQWLAALRSGDYKQGSHQLVRNDRYCCLGVACDLAVKAGVTSEWAGEDYPYFGDLEEWEADPIGAMDDDRASWAELPYNVRSWLGLPEGDPLVELPEDHFMIAKLKNAGALYGDNRKVKVSQLNDNGVTFAEIADLIEEQL